MVAGQTVATYAALIADPGRATMCLVRGVEQALGIDAGEVLSPDDV